MKTEAGIDRRRMNVLILNQYGLPRGARGITRHGDLGSVLAERGHRVTVLASRFNYLTRIEEPLAERQRATASYSGVRFRWIRTGSYFANGGRRIMSMAAYSILAVLAGVVTRPRPSVVVASSPHLFAGLAGAAIASLRRVPFVLEVRDFWPSVLVDLGAIARGGYLHRLLALLERWLYRRASLIIFVPPGGSRRLEELRLSRTRWVHIPNATDLHDGPRGPAPDSLSGLLRSLRPRRILLYAGAHGVANDLETVIRGLSVLREHWPEAYADVAFVSIGDGTQREALRSLAEAEHHQNVHFHPPVDKAALPGVFAMADVMLVSVAPASTQGYGLSPNKLFAYMAAAKPVLISSEMPTVADSSGAGRRYRPGDAGSFAHTLRELLEQDPNELAAMGSRGQSAIERTYSLAKVGAAFERELLAVCER